MSDTPDLVIVTGLSGAGKTHAMKVLEDLGYFCIDNLPPRFVRQLGDLREEIARSDARPIAVAMDVRGHTTFDDMVAYLDDLDARGTTHTVLYLDCSDEILVRRFSETRRRHPLADDQNLIDQIGEERRRLVEVRRRADVVIDTSHLRTSELAAAVADLVAGKKDGVSMAVDVVSFGFKHGVPLDVDLMLDVRFLPNPYYVDGLRHRTGLQSDVRDFVLDQPEAQAWMDDVSSLLERWVPSYQKTMRARLTIGIGCTGGQHRSVALTEALGARLSRTFGNVHVRHRDLSRANLAPSVTAVATTA